ncbi:MAG: GNAT family N-acetyltransferase [Burkholderiaceae bacterium]|nr:GNAT family N-acetyltransferase [Burkholderiaceae bacterium]
MEDTSVPDARYRILEARSPAAIDTARALFTEYQRAIGVDLCFQGFEAELRDLPGGYAPPAGRLLLAWRGNDALACVGLRDLGGGRAEMKRLYVRPSARGGGLGEALVARVLDAAREIGYEQVVLDTLPTMAAAQRLYARFGFADLSAYCDNPIPGTRYLGLVLAAHPSARTAPDDPGDPATDTAPAARIAAWIRAHQVPAEMLEFAQSVHSVADAVAASGHPVERITKSLVMLGEDGVLVVAMVPATHRASLERVRKALGLGQRPRLATAEEIEARTGQRAGGNSPLNLSDARIVIDPAIFERDWILTGGGDDRHLVRIPTQALRRFVHFVEARIRK